MRKATGKSGMERGILTCLAGNISFHGPHAGGRHRSMRSFDLATGEEIEGERKDQRGARV